MEDKVKELINSIYGDDINYDIRIEGNYLDMIVDDEHMGIVIGRGGRHAIALREIVKVYNKLHGTSFKLKIMEESEANGTTAPVSDIVEEEVDVETATEETPAETDTDSE